jgi:hypothetical protein
MTLSIFKQKTYNLKLTVNQLEELLAQPEYKAFKRLDYSQVQPELMDGVKKMDSVVSFGKGAIDLFDNLTAELKRLPTQKEYIEAGLPIYEAFWNENRLTHEKINGYPFTKGVKLGCMDRLARTYTSKVVELHLELLLKDMGLTVKTHPLLDSVMGVDMVVEDDIKRYYVHVTTSKHGIAGAVKSVERKEKRGKFMVGSTWVSYGRDFTGDCILCYESTAPLNDGSTKWINNIPLFNREYLEEYFALKRLGKTGELLTSKQSKLEDFKLWAKVNLKMNLNI